jgi:hypothetical protein
MKYSPTQTMIDLTTSSYKGSHMNSLENFYILHQHKEVPTDDQNAEDVNPLYEAMNDAQLEHPVLNTENVIIEYCVYITDQYTVFTRCTHNCTLYTISLTLTLYSQASTVFTRRTHNCILDTVSLTLTLYSQASTQCSLDVHTSAF